jgi:hypothetical protein
MATTAIMTAPASGVIATREDVQALADSCVFLRSQWGHFTTLFEGSDLKRELLQTTAPTFFGDLHALFVEHLVLHICRLTDGAQTMGRENLTVKFLMDHTDWSGAPGTLAKLKTITTSASASFRHASGSLPILIFPLCGEINRSARRRFLNGNNFGSTCRTSLS